MPRLHFGPDWRRQYPEAQGEPRSRTSLPTEHQHRPERAAARSQRSHVSRWGLLAAARRPASPESRWPARQSCSRPPHSRGNADRTSGQALARSDRHSRRLARRACRRRGDVAVPTYCAIVPRHETGSVRNNVSSRGSSNPSPMYLPVARMARPSFSGIAASRSARGSPLLFAHPTSQHDDVRDSPCIALLSKPIEVFVAFGEHERRPARSAQPERSRRR